MWLIFIISCIVVALAALFVIYIGHKIFLIMEKEDDIHDVQKEVCKQAKFKIQKEFKKDMKFKEKNKE